MTKPFWRATMMRALRTVAQTFLTLAAGNAVNLFDIGLGSAAIAAGGAAFLSICTSIVVGIPESPSTNLP